MNNEHINAMVDDLERPTKRMQRAITVIRDLQHECADYQARAHSLAATVAALQVENRRLRKEQGTTELDPRDARIVQLCTELRRLRKLLDDVHANPSAIAAEQERRQYEHDEYIREQGADAALKNLRQG
jgi:predicted  nucleic acid-binding Zn-ribbon protein